MLASVRASHGSWKRYLLIRDFKTRHLDWMQMVQKEPIDSNHFCNGHPLLSFQVSNSPEERCPQISLNKRGCTVTIAKTPHSAVWTKQKAVQSQPIGSVSYSHTGIWASTLHCLPPHVASPFGPALPFLPSQGKGTWKRVYFVTLDSDQEMAVYHLDSYPPGKNFLLWLYLATKEAGTWSL